MNEDYEFKVGDLVRINPEAFDGAIPKDWDKFAEEARTRLFTIGDRKVHWFTCLEEQQSTNMYHIPGYDWTLFAGNGWINEAWLTKWDGSGQLQITITLSSEGETRVEVEAEAREMLEKIRDNLESLGMPRSAISMLGIKYDDGPVIELDMVG